MTVFRVRFDGDGCPKRLEIDNGENPSTYVDDTDNRRSAQKGGNAFGRIHRAGWRIEDSVASSAFAISRARALRRTSFSRVKGIDSAMAVQSP
jgi:hypothetical protein